jgi:hypothetical protein
VFHGGGIPRKQGPGSCQQRNMREELNDER